MNQTEFDSRLTLDVVAKIVAAQRRGTLSLRMRVNRYPTQVVLEDTSEKDRAWIAKHFPGITEDHHHALTKKGRQRFEKHRYVARLRPELEGHSASWHRAPRLEVWGILVPHICREFRGSAKRTEAGARQVVWRCSTYNCNKPITKTQARELGLLP